MLLSCNAGSESMYVLFGCLSIPGDETFEVLIARDVSWQDDSSVLLPVSCFCTLCSLFF